MAAKPDEPLKGMHHSSPDLLVSVIIPTRNRARLLADVIESLFVQSLDPGRYEIIVVDNRSEDGTPKMIEELQRRAPCRLRYEYCEVNRGPVYTRNLGARLAQAPILAFTDSDCRAHPKWLERGLDAFERSSKVALVSGAVLDKPGQPVKFFTLRNGAAPGENYTYPTCNVFYRRDVFHELGGFDESVWLYDVSTSPIECADTDFAWKVREAGYDNFYSDDLIIYHEVPVVKPIVWLLYHTRLLVIPELVRRHPQLRRKLLLGGIFFSRENILFYLFLLGLILGVLIHPAMLLLCAPYLLWALALRGGKLTLARIPRLIARIPVFAVRHVVVCGSLLYGSLRSRRLVL